MKLIEIAKITVRRNKETNEELYFTVKQTVKDAISSALLKDVEDVVRCCTILNDGGKDIVKFRILLEEQFYNEHIGNMNKDVQKKELCQWLDRIDTEKLSLVGSEDEFISKLWCKINNIK